MKKFQRFQFKTPEDGQEPPIGSGTLLRTLRADGYEPGYARGTQAATQFVVSLRRRRTSGEIIVPNELGSVIARSMIRWEAAGGREMSIQPIADRSPGFETLCGEMSGFSAGLMDAL